MNDESDPSVDIDALFDHMVNNLDYNATDAMDWVFSLRSTDLATLTRIGEQMSDEFVVQLQAEVEEIDTNGDMSSGDPMLSVIRHAALSPDEVKAISSQMSALAEKENLVYEGVDCYDPVDDEELFAWLSIDDATWRLRHFADCGLDVDGDLPWTFLIMTGTVEQAREIAETLKVNGFDDFDVYDEPDDDGEFGLCVFVEGKNNEGELSQTFEKMEGIADKAKATLEGVQFFTREELNDLCDVPAE
jgi:hypothetical protein